MRLTGRILKEACDQSPGMAEKTKNEPQIKVFQAEDDLHGDQCLFGIAAATRFRLRQVNPSGCCRRSTLPSSA
jgi:hypothetical protein